MKGYLSQFPLLSELGRGLAQWTPSPYINTGWPNALALPGVFSLAPGSRGSAGIIVVEARSIQRRNRLRGQSSRMVGRAGRRRHIEIVQGLYAIACKIQRGKRRARPQHPRQAPSPFGPNDIAPTIQRHQRRALIKHSRQTPSSFSHDVIASKVQRGEHRALPQQPCQTPSPFIPDIIACIIHGRPASERRCRHCSK